jgi:hypothetical protein
MKIRKESIKEVVSAGLSIQFPFKSEISSWYGEIKLYKMYNFYYSCDIKFSNLDDAVNHFCTEAFTSKNVGYIQSRLMNKKLVDDGSNLERPDKDLKELFKEEAKIVDEEAKSLELQPIIFPSAKEAVEEFKSLVDTLTVDNIVEKLSQYERKYATLSPYINLNYKYDVEGSEYGYRQSFDYENFDKEDMEIAKTRVDLPQHKMKWNSLQISFKVNGDDFHFFYLNL